jgi:DNA polymerase/3'-5' exonuclease PolX
LELLDVPRLKPSAVLKLNDLGITTLGEAEDAARQGCLRKVPGLGASVERKILEGIAMKLENARHYDRPKTKPPVVVAAGGPHAAKSPSLCGAPSP